MSREPILVTRPSLPPLEDLIPLMEEIWKSRVLTNGGPLHQRLEQELTRYLGVENISLFSNGTLALIAALAASGARGEVITTPYSFVATSHSLLWLGLKPVFADVSPETLNLSPESVAAAITPHTTAILPVHCYGIPCDTVAIERIARDHSLSVIYDAAHAFGATYRGKSLASFGDYAILSFHATKVFNTFEGGAVVSPSPSAKAAVDRFKNFGIVDESTIDTVGFNAKLNELQAAVGLAQLPHVEKALEARRVLCHRYTELLGSVRGIRCLPVDRGREGNGAYFPVIVEQEFGRSRDELHTVLKARGVMARRYFHPLLSDLPMYRQFDSSRPENLPVAARAAAAVLCLPLFPDLTVGEQDYIVDLIAGAVR